MSTGDAQHKVEADFALAQQCAAGDELAQRQLFAAYKALVHSTLYRILGSNADMEDLVQDAFLEVFRSVQSFKGSSQLSTWVSRITARVAYAHLSRKKRSRHGLELVADVVDPAPHADSQASSREATRRLYQVLERIDPKHRIAFALHVIDGRSLREVAAVTESSIVATKSRVFRARREIYKRARKDPLLASYLTEQGVSG